MTITDHLISFRKEQNLNQEEMAEKLKMSKNGYAKIERGETKLTIAHLQKIIEEFGVDSIGVDSIKLSKDNDEDKNFTLLFGDGDSHFLHFANHYHGDTQLIEQLQLTIQHQDKEIELLRLLLKQANIDGV